MRRIFCSWLIMCFLSEFVRQLMLAAWAHQHLVASVCDEHQWWLDTVAWVCPPTDNWQQIDEFINTWRSWTCSQVWLKWRPISNWRRYKPEDRRGDEDNSTFSIKTWRERKRYNRLYMYLWRIVLSLMVSAVVFSSNFCLNLGIQLYF